MRHEKESAVSVMCLRAAALAAALWLGVGAAGQAGLCQIAKLLAADGAAGDLFGRGLSVCGDVAVVGAYVGDGLESDSGAAYICRFNGASWVQEQKLLANDGAASDRFGWSVSVSGDVVVVGADYDDDNGNYSGSAYIYRFNGTTRVQEQKLLAADGATGDFFGICVSVSGNVAVVGASLNDDNGVSSGSAYVYRFNGSTWVQEQELLASDGAAYSFLGGSVSVSGDVAVVGAYGDDDFGSNSGSAYVYRFNPGLPGWVEEQKLLASDGAVLARFGISVSVSDDVALVGADFGDGLVSDSGSAFVYRFNGAAWVQEQKLTASDGAAVDQFGRSVSVSGDVAVVGASGDDDDVRFSSGSAYAYRFNGSSWVQEQKLLASDGATGDFFGAHVSISGDVAVVGAYGDDENGGVSGSAYVFSLSNACPADTDCDGAVNVTDLLNLFAAWGPNPGHAADINGDGAVNVTDLLALFASWGGCS